MQASYFRNQFALHRNKIILMLCLGLAPVVSQAQVFKWARQNNPNYDERLISYGFMIGLHTSAYQVQYSEKFVTPQFDTLQSVMAEF